ncbi:MAG: ABC transporter permease [Gemmatimonadaceae bacterium]
MRRYLRRRLGHAAVIVFFVATGVFVLIHLAPGDPYEAALENPNVSAAMRAQWRATYGLDRPIAEQYLRWLAGISRGDFGWSFSLHRPVGDALVEALPQTLLLMGTALCISFTIGVVLGVVQAVNPTSAFDRVITAVSLLLYALPDFWLAVLALLMFAYWVPLFPPGGIVDPVMHHYLGAAGRLGDLIRHLALPTAVLTLLSAATIARFQRAAMLAIADADYLRTARAKGASERAVRWRHALRNALAPTATLVGLAFPALFGGSVFIERVFSWPGMGLLAMNAISTRDYPLVVASVIVGAATVTLGSLLADIIHVLVDPRVASS